MGCRGDQVRAGGGWETIKGLDVVLASRCLVASAQGGEWMSGACQALQEAGETPGTPGCCLLCCAWAGLATGRGVGVGPFPCSDQGQSWRESRVKLLPSPLPQGLSGTPGPEVHTHSHPPLPPCHVVTSIWVCVGRVPGGPWKAQRSQTLSDYQAREGWGHLRGSPGASLSSPAPPHPQPAVGGACLLGSALSLLTVTRGRRLTPPRTQGGLKRQTGLGRGSSDLHPGA